MDRLTVDLNRDGLHEIVAPSSFETGGPFEVTLRNHGEAVHVHLNLDDSLSNIGRLAAGNHFVEANNSRSVQVETGRTSAPITGRLKIVTGYGAEVAHTSVTVTPPGVRRKRVEVDEQLAVPRRTEPEDSSLVERLREAVPTDASLGVSMAIIGFGAVAIGLSVLVALSIDSPVVLFGSLLVVIGVVSALAITRKT